MELESRDERLKKFERAPIKTPQQQIESLQLAQAEIGSLTNERQSLLKQQQSTLMGYQQQLAALQNQAMAATETMPQQVNVAQQAGAMNAQTQAILQKYGVDPKKPQTSGSKTIQQNPIFQSAVVGAGTANIRTENKTTYNTKTTNNVQVIQPQENIQAVAQRTNNQTAKPAMQLRNQISQQVSSQNQQYEESKRRYFKMDISLRKGADMMMRKIDAASKRFAENMNPQKLAASSIDSTKVIMMLAVAYIGTKLIGPISKRLDKLYFWFTGETPEKGEKVEGSDYNEHIGFFDRLKSMIDTKKDDSLASKIIKFFKDGFEDIKGYLEIVFQDRVKAISQVKGLQEREKWFDGSAGGFKYFPAYLADIFTALIGGTVGQAKAKAKKQTKEVEKEAREQLLSDKDIPSGVVGEKASSDQYMQQLTEGGVAQNVTKTYGVSHGTGTYSIAKIQQQHELVRKNANSLFGNGTSIVTTEYAYALGGEKINIFEDERTKDYVKRLKFKTLDLLPFKLLQLKPEEYEGFVTKVSKFFAETSVPGTVINFLKIFWGNNDSKKNEEKEKERRRKIYEDLYNKLVKLLDKNVKSGEGWEKELKDFGKFGVNIKYEVYHFPSEEEKTVKKAVEDLIKDEIRNHSDVLTNGLLGHVVFGDSKKDLTKINKELFDAIKKIYDIKEYSTSDQKANEYFESMANADYKPTDKVDDQGQVIYAKSNNGPKTFVDKEKVQVNTENLDKAREEYQQKLDTYWMTREQDSSVLNSDLVKKAKGVAETVSNAVVNFRTDDSIEKSAPVINEIVEYLSKSLGIPKDAAIGIVSNLWAESKLNPIGLGDNNSSLGLAQWHYKQGIQQVIENIKNLSGIQLKTKEDGKLIRVDTEDQSWKNLQEFAKNNDNYRKLLFDQLDLIVKHLKDASSTSDYGKLYEQLKRTNNPMSAEDASQEFLQRFEKPDKARRAEFIKERREYATQIQRYLSHNFNEEKEDDSKEQVAVEEQQKEEDQKVDEIAEKISNQVTEYTVAASRNIKTEPPQITQVENSSKENQSEANVESTSSQVSNNIANIYNDNTKINNVSVLETQSDNEYSPISG